MAHTRAYCDGKLIKEDFPVADVSDFLEMPGVVVWVDYCKPSAADMEELQDELGFHELAIEDALGGHQRPEARSLPQPPVPGVPLGDSIEARSASTAVEIDAFIHPRWLVTVRKDEGFALEPVLERWDRSTDLAVARRRLPRLRPARRRHRPDVRHRSTSSTSSTTT